MSDFSSLPRECLSFVCVVYSCSSDLETSFLWLDDDIPLFNSIADLVELMDIRQMARMEQVIIDLVCMVVIWVLFTYHNVVLFSFF